MNDEQRKLVEDNIGLVGKTISKYYKQHLGDEDIYQIGCIGLIKAVMNYGKPDVAFSTYAVYTIRNALYQHFQEIGRVKRKSNINTQSIYEKVKGTYDIEFYEAITNGVDFTDKTLLRISLQSAFKQLDERNQKILMLYIQGYTFREMSSQMDITHQRISQIFNRKIKPLLREVAA